MDPDDEDIVRQLLEDLGTNDKLPRKYADFWNFHKKEAKESGLFSEIFDRIQSTFGSKIIAWGLCDNDPPDVWARFEDGRKIGLEITELVNQAAVEAQITGSSSYHDELFRFDTSVACSKICEIVKEKSDKTASKRADFDELYLLIHTDEHLLNSQDFPRDARDIMELPENVFRSVLLLFSYEPRVGESPLLNLTDNYAVLKR